MDTRLRSRLPLNSLDRFDSFAGQAANTVQYLYEGQQALGEIRNGQLTNRLLTGLSLDETIARIAINSSGQKDAANSRIFMTDALNSVIAQLADDNNASIQNSYGYSPYGEATTIGPDSTNNPIQYTSRENDGTGLYFYRARYYDPVLKIFVSEDPIRLRAGMNFRAYVEGNPLSYIDPLGLDATNMNNTSGGRSRVDGPTNGNWGGKCWSGGKYSCGPGNGPGTAPPTDSGDACYQRHDTCYVTCGANQSCIKTCDQVLKKELLDLPFDPRKWPQPPKPGTERDTIQFLNAAQGYF